ncbi:MAG: hypothetical protein IIT38_06505 [Bacteroidales bacterium]|nr:hypothetical protein [Bacteroidales bacterium]
MRIVVLGVVEDCYGFRPDFGVLLSDFHEHVVGGRADRCLQLVVLYAVEAEVHNIAALSFVELQVREYLQRFATVSWLCDVGQVVDEHLCVGLYVGGFSFCIFAQNPTCPPRERLVFERKGDKTTNQLPVCQQVVGRSLHIEVLDCKEW